MALYAAVIFDWGGVMADDTDTELMINVAKLMDLSYEAMLPYWEEPYRFLQMGVLNENDFWYRIEQSLGKVLPRSKYNVWDSWRILRPDPRMLELVRELTVLGHQAVIMTNMVAPVAERLRVAGHFNLFQPRLLSYEMRMTVPDPRIYRWASQQLGLLPSQCVFVDNYAPNLAPAAEIGMATIQANGPEHVIHDLSQLLNNQKKSRFYY